MVMSGRRKEGDALFLELALLLVKFLLLQVQDLGINAGNAVAGSRRAQQLVRNARRSGHDGSVVL